MEERLEMDKNFYTSKDPIDKLEISTINPPLSEEVNSIKEFNDLISFTRCNRHLFTSLHIVEFTKKQKKT